MTSTTRTLSAAVFSLALTVPAAGAEDHGHGDLVIDNPWARATAPNAPSGVAYMLIENRGDTDDRLIAAESARAERVEIHTHTMDDGVMRMRPLDNIDIPAGDSVGLEPGGNHIMLINLDDRLEEGTGFPMTLTFEESGEIEVLVHVASAGASDYDDDEDGDHHHDKPGHHDH